MFSTPESWTSKAIKEMILTILTTVFSPSYTSIQLCFSHPDLLAKLAKWDQFPRFSTLQLPETRLSKMFRKSGEKWPTKDGVWKSQKKSHSRLRAKRATFTFWVDKSILKMPKMVNFASFWKRKAWGQIVLPDRSILVGQNLWKMPKFK